MICSLELPDYLMVEGLVNKLYVLNWATPSKSIESDFVHVSTCGHFIGPHICSTGCGTPRRCLRHEWSYIGSTLRHQSLELRLLPTEYASWNKWSSDQRHPHVSETACQRRLVLGGRDPAQGEETRLLSSSLCFQLRRFLKKNHGY